MIPPRYENASYDDVPIEIKEMLKTMKVTKKGIFIHGSVGTGKTHIAYAICKKYEENKNREANFWSTTELFNEMKEDFDRHNLEKTNVLENLMRSSRLLILDDIGVEKPSEWVQEQFYLLINRQYNEMRPTIFTSNYSLEELAPRIGDRTVSRIVEMCHVVQLVGKDRRLP